MHSGAPARVALVPLGAPALITALSLEQDPGLEDDLIRMARTSTLIGERIGLDVKSSRDGIVMSGQGDRNFETVEIFVGADGAVMAQRSVASDGMLGGSIVNPERLEVLISAAGTYCNSVWERLDSRDEVRRVACVAAIHEAEHKVYGSGSSGRMTISMRVPPTVIAPDPPAVFDRAHVGSDRYVAELMAEVRRVFADAGALHS